MPGDVDTYARFERAWPVLAWTEPIYFSIYVAAFIFPALTRSARSLRRFALMGYSAMAVVFPLFLLLPFYANPRPFLSTSLFGSWLQLERSPISGAAAFPSFHVVWSCIVASTIAEGVGWKKLLVWTWALLVAASCVATGMHSIADVLAGFAAFIVVRYMPEIWQWILRAAEKLANSWREWRAGPVRIINHGAYAGAAAAVGIFIIDTLVGDGKSLVAFLICIGALVGAALWAQWVEGSPALLRPLGFYGGMLGSMAGATVALAMHFSLWSTFAAICVAAPWIQALGRLRCLVQGCCHGAPTQSVAGIRYVHPRSRVCRIAHFDGIPVHATPVYSILWNVFVGMTLLRLLQLHVEAAFLCGVYLLLSGSGRFVEEAYRGEPQTRVIGGLRFYQWIAIVCVVAGAVLTCLRTSSLSILPPRLSSVGLALGCGLLAWFVSGVDFPESSRRFARLT
jgi:membrane-associated phospholipid phosphatase